MQYKICYKHTNVHSCNIVFNDEMTKLMYNFQGGGVIYDRWIGPLLSKPS